MAFSILRTRYSCFRAIQYRTNNSVIFRTVYKASTLGDNRRNVDINKGRLEHIEDVISPDQSSITDNKHNPIRKSADPGSDSVECIPLNVREIRRQLRSLHGIALHSNTSLSRKPLARSTIDVEHKPDDYYTCDDVLEQEASPELVSHNQLQKQFQFLRKQKSNPSERVIETLYGYVRLDTNVVRHESKDDYQEVQPITMKGSEQSNRNSSMRLNADSEKGSKNMESVLNLKTRSAVGSEEEFVRHKCEKVNACNPLLAGQPKKRRSSGTETHNDDNHSRQDRTANIFDEQYFEGVEENYKETTKMNEENISGDHTRDDGNIFDEQYFGRDKHPTFKQSEDCNRTKFGATVAEALNDSGFVDQQYFGERLHSEEQEGDSALQADKEESLAFIGQQYFKSNPSDKNILSHIGHRMNEEATSHKYSSGDSKINIGPPNDNRDAYVKVKTKRELRMENRVRPNLEKPESAYDLAMKIRNEKSTKSTANHSAESKVPCDTKWSGETDSKGFRILKSQVLDLQIMLHDVVVKILKDSILYEDDGLIAIDKPYGLPSHGGPGVHHSVGQLLEPLAEKCHLKDNKLYLIHRLDKETTGIMLLAKTPQSQSIIHDMFVKQQVIKKYWLITKGIPDPPEGVIDIPMGEGTVGDKVRMALRPRYPKEYKLMMKTSRRPHCFEAVTNYKVLDSNHKAALVECQPESGIKHQIRCHMAFALNTPVLGDHKYSHFSKLAPQKLHPEILQRLGIRQSKVRHLPMHLHARQIVLPEYLNGRNLLLLPTCQDISYRI